MYTVIKTKDWYIAGTNCSVVFGTSVVTTWAFIRFTGSKFKPTSGHSLYIENKLSNIN